MPHDGPGERIRGSGRRRGADDHRAWGNVLGNLKRRFESGPVDWTAWLETLQKARVEAAAKK